MTIQLDPIPKSFIEEATLSEKTIQSKDQSSETDTREVTIEQARAEILEITTDIHTKNDPYLIIRDQLKPIIDYQTTRKLLYVKDSALEEYFPLCPIGPYTYADEVVKCIDSQIFSLIAYIDQLGDTDKWIALRLASEVINGLTVMIEDYSHSHTYQAFMEQLTITKNFLAKSINKISLKLNESIESLTEQQTNYSIFDLWELPAESYPQKLLNDCVEWFQHSTLIQSFLIKNADGRVPKEALRDEIIAVATTVTKQDVDQILIQQGLYDVPIEKWNNTLQEFRHSPSGQSFIEYFQLPISYDKFEIDDSALDQRPYLKSASPQGQCETAVLTDIEAAQLWDSKRQVYMSKTEMYDQLNTLFQNPYEPQLFHTDKYLSFLTVAATSLAYLESCQRQPDEIQHKIQPLIFLLEDITDHAHKMYPKKYVETYKSEWLTLIAQLKMALQNADVDCSSYYIGLFAHPDQNGLLKKKALATHTALQPSEYLARKVGYWNQYYLTDPAFIDDKGRLNDTDTISNRIGTIFPLSVDQEIIPYTIKKLQIYDGYVCQICMPLFFDETKPIPIKIVYQGTIPNRQSEKRDTNPIGPGYGLWKENGTSLLKELIELIEETSATLDDTHSYAIEFCGHSLGASDAQNGAATFSNLLVNDSALKDVIHQVDVHTFNPAGIPESSSNQFYTNMVAVKEKLGKIRHSMVKNDVVEISAQNKLGANFTDFSHLEIMEISNLGVYHIVTNHCLYAHSATDTILPHKLLDPKNDEDAHAIHSYLFGITHGWKDLTNHAHDMIENSPITKIAFNSLYLVGIVFGIGQIKKIEERIASHVTSPLIHRGIEKVEDKETSYLNKHVREAIQNIWQAFNLRWKGTQILEGTG
jgi:hypothetical protein